MSSGEVIVRKASFVKSGFRALHKAQSAVVSAVDTEVPRMIVLYPLEE